MPPLRAIKSGQKQSYNIRAEWKNGENAVSQTTWSRGSAKGCHQKFMTQAFPKAPTGQLGTITAKILPTLKFVNQYKSKGNIRAGINLLFCEKDKFPS